VAQGRECYIVSASERAATIATRRHDLGTVGLGGAVASDRGLAIAPLIALHRDRLPAKTAATGFGTVRVRPGASRGHPREAFCIIS
jgi:hypothetical protein